MSTQYGASQTTNFGAGSNFMAPKQDMEYLCAGKQSPVAPRNEI